MSTLDGATTPILAGFYPDPSICRVGEDYYLVTSSFELFPGVPIWHSRDLVTWTQIGNVLDRPSQLNLEPMTSWVAGGSYRSDGKPARPGAGSDGIYAPTIRHHGGRFWMTTTVANLAARGPLIVSAENPAGPWTDPVYVDGLIGIDSDLFWDDDDTCHMTFSAYGSGVARILTVPIDPVTGRTLGETRELWQGTGGLVPEAPHLYRREGWWYLMLAEGGTAAGHAVTIARAESLDGPWHSHPANPILSHRGIDHPVQYTGHGDLVETPDGEWAIVYLGVRLRGFPGFHVNGRETFLAGVEWRDGWPYVVEDRYHVPVPDHGFVDDLSLSLGPDWVSVGRDASHRLESAASGTRITAGEGEWDAFVGVRTRDDYWTAELDVDVNRGSGALTLRLSDDHFVEIRASADGRQVVATSAGLGTVATYDPETTDGTARLFVRTVPASGILVHVGPDVVEVGEIVDDTPRVLFRLDGRHVSTEVAGGFTGRLVGVRALSGSITVSRFAYHPDRPELTTTALW
ncbi:MAG TPA: family 43 glycosylhydrolase [Pseudolysinimonas sp.]|nr:family 43 glycosylhydrolase [Pseudolysinimonas sp.]